MAMEPKMVEIELLSSNQQVEVELMSSPQSINISTAESQTIRSGDYLAGDYINIENHIISAVPVDLIEDGNLAPVTSNAVADGIAGVMESMLITGVTDEFIISDDKILGIDKVNVDKIEDLAAYINDVVEFPVATDMIAGIVKSASGVDQITVASDGTMTVNQIRLSNIVQDEDLVLNGGNSNY